MKGQWERVEGLGAQSHLWGGAGGGAQASRAEYLGPSQSWALQSTGRDLPVFEAPTFLQVHGAMFNSVLRVVGLS